MSTFDTFLAIGAADFLGAAAYHYDLPGHLFAPEPTIIETATTVAEPIVGREPVQRNLPNEERFTLLVGEFEARAIAEFQVDALVFGTQVHAHDAVFRRALRHLQKLHDPPWVLELDQIREIALKILGKLLRAFHNPDKLVLVDEAPAFDVGRHLGQCALARVRYLGTTRAKARVRPNRWGLSRRSNDPFCSGIDSRPGSHCVSVECWAEVRPRGERR